MQFWLIVSFLFFSFTCFAVETVETKECNGDETLEKYITYLDCLKNFPGSYKKNLFLNKEAANCIYFFNYEKNKVTNNIGTASVTVTKKNDKSYMREFSLEMENEHGKRNLNFPIEAYNSKYVRILKKDGSTFVSKILGYSYLDVTPNPDHTTTFVSGGEKLIFDNASIDTSTLDLSEINRITPITEEQYQTSLNAVFLANANLKPGTVILKAATEYVIEEFKGEITDKAKTVVYARAKNSKIASKLPISQIRDAVIKSPAYGGFVKARARVMPKANLYLTAAELALVPTMLACATLDDMYIDNRCDQKNPSHVALWFHNLNNADKIKALKSSQTCQILNDFLDIKAEKISRSLFSGLKSLNEEVNKNSIKCNSKTGEAVLEIEHNFVPRVFMGTEKLHKYRIKLQPNNSTALIEEFNIDNPHIVTDWVKFNSAQNSEIEVSNSKKINIPVDHYFGVYDLNSDEKLTNQENSTKESVSSIYLQNIFTQMKSYCLGKTKQPSNTSVDADSSGRAATHEDQTTE